MFSTILRTKIIILANFILSSANAFDLDQSRILSFGKDFMQWSAIRIDLSTLHGSKPFYFWSFFLLLDKNEFLYGSSIVMSWYLRHMASNYALTLYHASPTFNDPRNEGVWKHYGKRRKCCSPAFSPFPTMFSTRPGTNFNFWVPLFLSSAKKEVGGGYYWTFKG